MSPTEQEHLALLRELPLALPQRFAALRPLTDPDLEVDFLTNVAHLQLHRRGRWALACGCLGWG